MPSDSKPPTRLLPPTTTTPGGVEIFTQRLTRTACAQIIHAQAERLSATRTAAAPASRGQPKPRPLSAHNVHVSDAVSDALADIAAAYLQTVARAAARRAQLVGRSAVTLLDVLDALQAVAPVTNSNVRDLAKYAMYQEVPFPYRVPPFPVLPPPRKRPRDILSDAATATATAAATTAAAASASAAVVAVAQPHNRPYVEAWMPPMPSAHTYVATPVFVPPRADGRDAARLGRERRGVEKSLAKLKEAQGGGGGEAAMAAVAAAAPENPYVALPRVGSGEIFDEDRAGEARELTEAGEERTGMGAGAVAADDAHDSNTAGLVDLPRTPSNDQKRAKVVRILAEAMGGGTTAVGGTDIS